MTGKWKLFGNIGPIDAIWVRLRKGITTEIKRERMVRPAGFEPATYGFEVRTPGFSQPPQNSEVVEIKGFSF